MPDNPQPDSSQVDNSQSVNPQPANPQDDKFRNMLPKEERQYYDKMSEGEKESLRQDYPRTYLEQGQIITIPEDRYALAKGIFWEAEESQISNEGKEAVGWVIRNRRDNEYKGATTYEDVLTARKQFSSKSKIENEELLKNTIAKNQFEWESWKRSVQAATKVDNAPPDSDPTNGADHFYSPKRQPKPPKWAVENKRMPVDGVDIYYFKFYRVGE